MPTAIAAGIDTALIERFRRDGFLAISRLVEPLSDRLTSDR